MERHEDLARQLEAISHILPLWKKNLALARQQVEQGGGMVATRFSGIVERLRRAILQSAEEGGELDGCLASTFVGMQEELRDLQLGDQNLRQATAQAQRMVDAMLERLETAILREQESARALREESAGIQAEIAEMLVALQHHDRVSQILGHVERDLDKMFGKLNEITRAWRNGDSVPEIELEHWLEELERSYSTQEQRTVHHGQTASAPSDNDITFF
ncbi:methyl-accepting chemotaxis protein [Formivibrio citricus]|uniref:Methyl-accepting chemotaxis protein n=1 Tax=Formivibrio citricus TaxID=83765 RepID=A0A1I4V6E6_9NEIS|nr:hypothetical protein [Formivibrio citricus]SFM96731.1 methyl-accepting chemotaxis protein [Formivibrio citricus]